MAVLIATMQVRRGTTAEWAASNRVLLDGEIGCDTTTDTYKLGNGVTPWSGLAPVLTGDVANAPGFDTAVEESPAIVALVADVAELVEDIGGIAATQAGTLSIDRITPGGSLVIDYYKNVYGAIGAWPATRPTTRVDIDVTWRGPTDPGTKMLSGDMFELTTGV